ncbi:MAG TPA: RagB/SusD family nutrient uptake outer membrane protein [Chryseolinea sp.]
MKAKFINFIFVLSVVVLLPSCDDYLALDPISTNTSANAYLTASDAEAALTGVYDSFSQEYYIWDNIIFNDVMSDNYYAGGDNAQIFAVEDLNVVPTNDRLWNNWSQIYNGVLKANVVLDKVPGITDIQLTETRRSQILGEASFLRAYHYYQLVKMWGGVPLITKPVSSTSASETQIAQSTEAEVYAQIIADLEFAVANLPDKYSDAADVNKARATKGAANAMLAKVYAQKSDRDYAKVIQYANAVISSPAGYTLLAKYSDLWDGSHYNNAESIMEVQFVGGTEANWGPGLLLPPSITNDTWRKFVTPSHDLINAFDAEGDTQRKEASILFEKAPWADEFWSVTVNGEVPFAYKWKTSVSSTNRQYIVRLADIILLKAEAMAATGDISGAKTALNLVRHRAGLGDTPATDAAQLKTAVLNERRLELTQEAQRWDDLRRNNVAVDVMNNLVELNLITGQQKVYNMTTEKQLLPIPQSERNRNVNLGQNPGYN